MTRIDGNNTSCFVFSDTESCKHKFEITNILAGEVHTTRIIFTDYKSINR